MQLTCGEIALLCAGVWRRYHRGVGAGVACTPAVRENVRPVEEERTTANGPGPIPDDVVGGFRAAPPATLGPTRTAGFVDPAIRPVDRRRRVVVGPAVTLTLSPGDVTHARGALGVLGAGRVLVIGAGGVGPAACWGEMTPLAAKVRDAAGVLVDGLVTDVVEIEAMDVPTRSRGIAALVVADDDGVVVIGPAEAVCAEARAPDDHRPPHQRTPILGGGLLAEPVGRDAAGMGAELAERGHQDARSDEAILAGRERRGGNGPRSSGRGTRDIARQLYPLLAGPPALDPATLGTDGPRSGPPTTLSSGERPSPAGPNPPQEPGASFSTA